MRWRAAGRRARDPRQPARRSRPPVRRRARAGAGACRSAAHRRDPAPAPATRGRCGGIAARSAGRASGRRPAARRPRHRIDGERRSRRRLRPLAACLRTRAGAADALVQPRPQPATGRRERSRARCAATLPRAGAGVPARAHPRRRRAAAPRLPRRVGGRLPRARCACIPPAATRGAAWRTSEPAAVGRGLRHAAHAARATTRRGRPHRHEPRSAPAKRRSATSMPHSPRWRCQRAPAPARAVEPRRVRRLRRRHARRDGFLPALRDPRLGHEAIFIVGMPRSGSTLFEQILAAHPQVEGASELPDLGDVIQAESRRRGKPFRNGWRTRTPTTGSASAATTCAALRAGAPRNRASPTRCRRTGNSPACCAPCCRARPCSKPGAIRWKPHGRASASRSTSCRIFPATSPTSPPACAVANGDGRDPRAIRRASGCCATNASRPNPRSSSATCSTPAAWASTRPASTSTAPRAASAPPARRRWQPLRGDTARAGGYGARLDPLRAALGLPPA